jgi:DNA-binding transcriptional MerR regulator
MSDENYYQRWYEQNGNSLNAARREKYASDPEYRSKILKRNRAARKKRREMTVEERRAIERAKHIAPAASWKTVQQEIDLNGRKVVATLFSIGALAKRLDRGISTVRVWERQGLLPETPYRSEKGDRLYTLDMVESIRRALWEAGKLTEADGKLREKKRPDAVVRWVRFADGREQYVPLYKFGVLAQAVQRTVVALAQMEKLGRLPETPLRASSLNYRLYTVEMIEIVAQAFRRRGGSIRARDEWEEFHDEIEKEWMKLGVGKNAQVIGKENEDEGEGDR